MLEGAGVCLRRYVCAARERNGIAWDRACGMHEKKTKREAKLLYCI